MTYAPPDARYHPPTCDQLLTMAHLSITQGYPREAEMLIDQVLSNPAAEPPHITYAIAALTICRDATRGTP
jgi:hypothetical protein